MKFKTLLWALLLTATGGVQAKELELKRLFYTPEQRVQIEQGRQAYLNPSATPRHSRPKQDQTRTNDKPRVSAIIVMPDGQRQARVGGQYKSMSDNNVQLNAQGRVTKSNDVE